MPAGAYLPAACLPNDFGHTIYPKKYPLTVLITQTNKIIENIYYQSFRPAIGRQSVKPAGACLPVARNACRRLPAGSP